MYRDIATIYTTHAIHENIFLPPLKILDMGCSLYETIRILSEANELVYVFRHLLSLFSKMVKLCWNFYQMPPNKKIASWNTFEDVTREV